MTSRTYRSVVRERAAAATRAAVLAAAGDVFAEVGFSAATMVEIAARAEVGVQTVYAKFGTKAGLMAEVLKAVAEGESAQSSVADVGAAAAGRDVLDRLAAGIRGTTEPTYALVGVALSTARDEPVIRQALDTAIAGYRDRIAVAVDRIDALGDLRRDLRREDAVDILWFFLGVSAWRVLVDQGWPWSRAQRFLTAQAGAALLGSGPS